MLSYALLSKFGSFTSYFQWGGLPTQIGAVLFLAAAFCALSANKKEGGLFILFFGTIAIAHHLSALIYTWALLFYMAATALTHSEKTLRKRLWQLLVSTALIFSPYLVFYAARIAQLGDTDALTYAYDDAELRNRQASAGMGARGCFCRGRAGAAKTHGSDRVAALSNLATTDVYAAPSHRRSRVPAAKDGRAKQWRPGRYLSMVKGKYKGRIRRLSTRRRGLVCATCQALGRTIK